MSRKKFSPISKTISLTVLIHILVMCIGLSYVTYRIYNKSFYGRYRAQMLSILNYVQGHIDVDDMSECARTYVESAKYKETQEFFDDFVDNYNDFHYMYILKVTKKGDPVRIRSICSANSTYEKENKPENVLHLGDGEEDWYSEEMAEKFRAIQEGDEDFYFLQKSAWGADYTLARPLIDSKGEHFGVLCVDISLGEMRKSLYRSIAVNIIMILLFGAAFMFILLAWLNHHVISPIKELEDEVKEYADSSSGRHRPEELIFDPPEMKYNNEISALSESVYKMSVNMIDYLSSNVKAEKQFEGLKGYVTKINDVAYCDPLTGVKNRAAYDRKVEALENDIFNKMAHFAVVMADANNLKKINDEYGHDKGNEYIIGTCRLLSDIFKRSPMFRIGGDEFVIIVEGKDYRNRDELLKTAQDQIASAASNRHAKPWLRYSAALGMADYIPDVDDCVDKVFKRADKKMYAAKVEMKSRG